MSDQVKTAIRLDHEATISRLVIAYAKRGGEEITLESVNPVNDSPFRWAVVGLRKYERSGAVFKRWYAVDLGWQSPVTEVFSDAEILAKLNKGRAA